MRRTVRILFWSAGVVLVLVIAAAIALPAWIDPNQYRGHLESRLRESLGREVRLGEIGLRVLPSLSVSVRDIAVQETGAGDAPPFVAADGLRGSMKILPLLRRQLEIGKITLEAPRIHLKRDPDGGWNFDDILARLAAGGTANEASAGEGFASPRVSRLDIRDGTVVLEDGRIDPGTLTRLELRELDLAVWDFSPRTGFDYDFRVSLPPHEGKRLRFRGRIDLASTDEGYPFRADLNAPDLNPAAVGPYLDHFLGLGIEAGTVSLDAEATGSTGGTVDLAGRVDLDGIRPRESESPPLDLRADFDFSVDTAGDRFQFRSLEVKTEGSELNLRGSVDLRDGRPRVDGEVLPSRIRPADLKDLLATAGTALPVELESPDPLRIACRVNGFTDAPAEMELEGTLEVSRVTFRHPSLVSPLEEVGGRIAIGANRFAIEDFAARLGASDLRGELQIEDFAAPRIRFQLHSREARLGEILSFLDTPEEAGSPAAPAPAGTDWQDYLGRVSARGTLKIDRGNLNTLEFSGFEGAMELEGRTVRFDPLRMELYGGTFTGSAGADLGSEPVTFRLQSSIRDLDSQPLLADNTEMKDFRGRMSGEIRARGPLLDYDGTIAGLEGGGRLEIVDGAIGALNVLEVLAKASDLFGERTLKELSGRIAQQGSEFTRLAGNFTVGGGDLRSNDLELLSPDVDVNGAGTFSLLTGRLDGKFDVHLSAAVSRTMREEGSKAASLFWNDRTDRVRFPLGLRGTLAEPVPSVDWKTASEGLIRRKARDQLQDALGLGSKPQAPAVPPSPAQPPAAGVDGAPPADDAGGLEILLREGRFSGNFLLPDLKLSGRFRGPDLSHAGLRVVDAGGREYFSDDRAFPDLADDDGAVRTGDILEVPFFLEIPGKRLVGVKGSLQVSITLVTTNGESKTHQFQISR